MEERQGIAVGTEFEGTIAEKVKTPVPRKICLLLPVRGSTVR